MHFITVEIQGDAKKNKKFWLTKFRGPTNLDVLK